MEKEKIIQALEDVVFLEKVKAQREAAEGFYADAVKYQYKAEGIEEAIEIFKLIYTPYNAEEGKAR